MIDSTPWVDRPRPGPRPEALALAAADRAELERLLRTGTTEQRVARRAQGLLLLADGVAHADVARLVGVDERTVRKWCHRFAQTTPLDRLADAPRSGRPPSLSRPRTVPA